MVSLRSSTSTSSAYCHTHGPHRHQRAAPHPRSILVPVPILTSFAPARLPVLMPPWCGRARHLCEPLGMGSVLEKSATHKPYPPSWRAAVLRESRLGLEILAMKAKMRAASERWKFRQEDSEKMARQAAVPMESEGIDCFKKP